MENFPHGLEVCSPQKAEEVQRQASTDGLQVSRINLGGVRSKPALLQAIGKGLALPDYYRPNWDSLDECLRDFAPGKGWLVIVEHADELLALPRQEVAMLGGVLSDAVEFWRTEGPAFSVCFIGGPALKEALSLAPGEPPR
jgi:hypothetical protein